MKESLSCFLISVFLDQYVEGISILIDGSPKIMKLTPNLNEHLIKKPGITPATGPIFQGTDVFWAEPITPRSAKRSSTSL